jgi:hypothetical protein
MCRTHFQQAFQTTLKEIKEMSEKKQSGNYYSESQNILTNRFLLKNRQIT